MGLVYAMAAKGLTQHTETAADERLGSAPLWLWDPWMTCVVSRRITDKRWTHSIFCSRLCGHHPSPVSLLNWYFLPVWRACKSTGYFDCNNIESVKCREKRKKTNGLLIFYYLCSATKFRVFFHTIRLQYFSSIFSVYYHIIRS